MLSIFYTRKEIATRISILYTGNILATAFAGLIAAGVFSGMDELAGLAGWQWLFILQGAVTFVVAICAVFILPDDPLKTRWLTPEERELANRRIEADTVGARHQTSTFKGLLDAAKDPKVRLPYFQVADCILTGDSYGSLLLCNICISPRMASKISSQLPLRRSVSIPRSLWFSPARRTLSLELSPFYGASARVRRVGYYLHIVIHVLTVRVFREIQ